jgi:hypothetical protein
MREDAVMFALTMKYTRLVAVKDAVRREIN